MVDSVENRVMCVRLARERTSRGLPSWKATIKIKDILAEDRDNRTEAHAASVANRIADRIKAALPVLTNIENDGCDWDLWEIVDNLASLRPGSFEDCEDYTVLEDLNNRLSEFYDWADKNRYWID
jgi:hypothetical protein